MGNDITKDYISARQAINRLDISDTTFYKLVKNITVYKVGNHSLFSIKEIDRIKAERETKKKGKG